MKTVRNIISVSVALLLLALCVFPAVSAKSVYADVSKDSPVYENIVTGVSLNAGYIEMQTECNVPAQAIVAVLDGSYAVKAFKSARLTGGVGTTRINMDFSSLTETDSVKIIIVNAVTLKPLCDVYNVNSQSNGRQARLPKGEGNYPVAFVIKDSSGDPISGATATAVCEQTGTSVSFGAQSDENGLICASLENGDYTVTASKDGYTQSVIKMNVNSSSKASVITMNGDNGYVEHKRYIREYQWYNGSSAICEGVCGENLTWIYNQTTGELQIIGSGEMYDFENTAPWAVFGNNISRVTIDPAVTGIGANAFKNCTALEEFEITSNIAAIGSNAFLGCENLKTVINNSTLEVVKGSTTNGYVAYYATDVFITIDGNNQDEDWSPVYKSVKPVVSRGDSEPTTRTYVGLTPGENYVVYAVNSLDTDIFAQDNLIYVNQQKSDSNGTASFVSDCFADGETQIFLMGTAAVDISEAEVRIPVKTYNGKLQLASPELSLNGETLVFGEDYYFTGNSFASESGAYDFSVAGVGKYGGEKSCQFTIISHDGLMYKDGCIFLGWYDSPADDASPYLPSFEGDDIYAYPHWEDIPDISVDQKDIYRAYGEDYTSSAGFNLLGAQIRYNENDNINGLRFVSRISTALITKLEGLDGDMSNNSATYGHYLKSNLPPEAVLDKTNGKKLQAEALLYSGANYKTFSAVIYQIPESGCNTEISVRPYIEYTDANGVSQTYYFTEKTARNYNGAYHTTISRVAKYIVENDETRLNNSLPGLQEYIRYLAGLYNGD
ncbi:MAG: leucine-rich repeat protein [Clostridiales bacterium]|nr:leucine-rich repeat protein [Clostridiales bacterium]